MIYYADIKNNLIQGYYCEEIHGSNIPSNAIRITEDLWKELITYGQVKVDFEKLSSYPSVLDDNNIVYGMDHKDAFLRYVSEIEPVDQEPTEIDKLKEEIAELKILLHSTLKIN